VTVDDLLRAAAVPPTPKRSQPSVTSCAARAIALPPPGDRRRGPPAVRSRPQPSYATSRMTSARSRPTFELGDERWGPLGQRASCPYCHAAPFQDRLEFATEVDGKQVEGIDKLTFDQDGLITELKVMIGPASAFQLVAAKMTAEFPKVGLGLPGRSRRGSGRRELCERYFAHGDVPGPVVGVDREGARAWGNRWGETVGEPVFPQGWAAQSRRKA
jgi:hypothetical protein